MKQLLFVAVILALFSCSAKHELIGNYYKDGKDFYYELELHKDSTFFLRQKYFEADAQCKGRWSYVYKDTILLKCESNDLTASISMGNMANKEEKLIVINKKLKLNQVILIKKNN